MGIDHRVLQEAAQWFAVLQSGAVSAAERQAWSQWIERPEHARAWARVERISGQLLPLSADPVGRTAGGLLQQQRTSRRQALKLLGLVCGGAGLTLATGSAPWREWTANQRTAVGEVRDLRLSDGSRLWLNTGSAVDIAFDRHARQLSLYRGELLIDAVGGQSVPPLLLNSREGRLRSERSARFSVRQGDGRTQLSVFAGAVEIQLAGLGVTSVAAGQQAGFSAGRIGPLEPVRAERQAWSTGVLLADNQRLADFLAELSRYRHGYLGCDPRIADLRVVGAFPLGDTERVLEALAATLPVRIQRRMAWWVRLEPAV
ncbi:FecR domain-containing protein [Pseudomonas lopnurensis]|uniref:FecR domain-containing protein n=1 Tax=Pseudomonas lopnurensis TaxID=1477517 RepID=UPI0028AD178E|nr:FecR domain-containing protein [Pseudomonas lopnurensis]